MDPRMHLALIRNLLAGLLVLAFVGAAHAEPRLYTASLLITAFANDTTTGTVAPFTYTVEIGIPLTGNCNTEPLHPLETLTFPTTAMMTPTLTHTFTIPKYGGAVPTLDTNGDTVPDIAPGCGSTTVASGDPLVNGGLTIGGKAPGAPHRLMTTGMASTSRTSMDPRKISFVKSRLNKKKTGASFARYGVYRWEVHVANLHNDAGSFAKNGGDGDFAVTHTAVAGTRKVVQTAGKNKFGGVMRLLGFYGDNEGYYYATGMVTSVFYFNWLFDYLGAGGQATNGTAVTAGYKYTYNNYGNTRSSGAYTTSNVEVEAFKWTTGKAHVTAIQGSFPTNFTRTGYDNRTAMGSGIVQLVAPMLTHWVGAGVTSTGAIGILNIVFAPEPSQWMMLGAGVSLMGLLFTANRRNRP